MSDIRMVTAPIGGGKSLFEVTQICEALAKTERLIVTNIPIILHNAPEGYMSMQEWCDKYVKRPIRVNRRIFVLTAEQTSEFWKYLPRFDGILTGSKQQPTINKKVTLQDVLPGAQWVNNQGTGYYDCSGIILGSKPHPQEHEKGVTVTDYDALKSHPLYPGIDWHIDECHVNFSSRAFFHDTEKSQAADYFMSQVRKLNGNIDLVSQHPEKVDKNFRRNVTEWWVVRNMARTPLFMGAGFSGGFRYSRWQQAEQPEKGESPTNAGWYRMGQKEYKKVYFTMAGTGMSGSQMANEANRYKMRSPLVWAIPVIVAAVLIIFGPKYIEKMVASVTGGIAGGMLHGVQRGVSTATPVQSNQQPIQASQPIVTTGDKSQLRTIPVRQLAPTSEGAYESSTLSCVGVFQMGTNVQVMLSNGQVADSAFGDVQGIGHAWVKVFGMAPIPIRPGVVQSTYQPHAIQLPQIHQ